MTDNNDKAIRVGSRKSELALIQTKYVISCLQKLYPDNRFEIHTMSTIGDRILNISLPKIGEKSLFTKDLEEALHNKHIDIVVHSLKDLPTALPNGMAIGAILKREDSRDALVLNEKYKGMNINDLPKGSIIGTSSLRRTAQIKRCYPHLEVCDIRGNLNTRLAKLDSINSKFAGIILAHAGLIRMGWINRISQILEPCDILYAVGQGALAVECRSDDTYILNLLKNLICIKTTCKILAERSFLKTLGGGCSAPVAVESKLNLLSKDDNKNLFALNIQGAVWSLDGKIEIRDNLKCTININFNYDECDSCGIIPPAKKFKKNNYDTIDININDEHDSTIITKSIDHIFFEDGIKEFKNVKDFMNLPDGLFKKCPFFNKHEHDRVIGNTSNVKDCPLKIPIGQDFMGKCPYVDIENKVKLIEENDTKDNNNIDINHLISGIECPFKKVSKDLTAEKRVKLNKNSETSKFIEIKNIKKISSFQSDISYTLDKADTSNKLICGFYCHECFSKDLFKVCENLGSSLANNLINKGALDVMKSAQQMIRDTS